MSSKRTLLIAAMGVPGQILQHLFGTAERRLGIDHPADVGGCGQRLLELVGREAEFTLGERRTESGQELAAKHPTQDANRQEEVAGRGHPTGAIRGQPAAGHDAMDMRVELKVLAPGMQHGQGAGLGTQELGVGGQLEHGLGGGPHEQVVDDPRIGQGDRVEGVREREDEMEVRHGQQLGGAGLQPPCRGRGLAGGAVAIAAGVVGDLLMPALGAPQDVTSQGRRAAGDQIVQGTALFGRQPRAVAFQELVETAPDDLGHGGPRSGHD